MNIKTKLILLTILMFLMPAPVTAGWFNSCNSTIPETSRPEWLNPGYSKPDYFIGIGIAERHKNEKDQRELAEKNALDALSGNISVKVKSSYSKKIQNYGNETNEEVESRVEFSLNTETEKLLKDVDTRKKWLDKDKCVLYALAAVSKASVEKVKKEVLMRERFNEMVSIYKKETGGYNKLNLYDKQKFIEGGFTILQEIDFTIIDVPKGQKFYLNGFINEISGITGEISKTELLMSDRFKELEVVMLDTRSSNFKKLNYYDRIKRLEKGEDILKNIEFTYISKSKGYDHYSNFFNNELNKEQQNLAEIQKVMNSHLNAVNETLNNYDHNVEKSLRKNLDSLKQSRIILSRIDFTYIPSSDKDRESYENRINKAVKEVEDMMTHMKDRVMIVLISENEVTAKDKLNSSLLNHLKENFKKSDICEKSFSSLKASMKEAKEKKYPKLAAIKVIRETKEINMQVKGTLNINFSVYNTENEKIISGPVSTFGQILSWDEETLNWDIALKQIIKSNQLTIDN